MKIAAIIPAAGTGVRTGMKTPKPFLTIAGHPILSYSLRAFQRHPTVTCILPVLSKKNLSSFQRRIRARYRLTKCLPPVPGGPGRQDSVYEGLKALPGDVDIVIVHDAARPFLTSSLITDAIEGAVHYGAALAAVPVQDTLKRATQDRLVDSTVDRSYLWQAQTPQAFSMKILREAHDRAFSAGYRGTDDVSLVERLGLPVRVVSGSARNFKITTPDDIALARSLLRST